MVSAKKGPTQDLRDSSDMQVHPDWIVSKSGLILKQVIPQWLSLLLSTHSS